ncbi:MAG: hypothetical protein JEZ14_26040 [Marinilabiliaceae bacterium]|nr:hypothetical protein [Marinilabiliaceae bacterium]
MTNRIHVVVDIIEGVVAGIYADGDVAVTVLDDTGFDFGDPEFVDFNISHSEDIVPFEELKKMVDAFNKKVAHDNAVKLKPFVGEKTIEEFFFSLIGKYHVSFGSIPSVGSINKALESLQISFSGKEFKNHDDFESTVVLAVHEIEVERSFPVNA